MLRRELGARVFARSEAAPRELGKSRELADHQRQRDLDLEELRRVDHAAVFPDEFPFQRERDRLFAVGDAPVQKLRRPFCELRRLEADAAASRRLVDGESGGGGEAFGGVRGDSQLAGDGVGFQKPDAVYLFGEAVGVLFHHLGGVVAVALEEPPAVGGGHAEALQKDEFVAAVGVLLPRGGEVGGAAGADPRHFDQPPRGLVEDGERLLPEVLHDQLGGLGADPRHRAAEKARDAVAGPGQDLAEGVGLEFAAELGVILEVSGEFERLAGGRPRQHAAGDEFLPLRVEHHQHREAGIPVLVADVVDFAGDGGLLRQKRGIQARRSSVAVKKENWYPGRDSNPYALRHKILSLVCLPFHHPDATYRGLI